MAPMRDSGIPKLGRIPAHWKVWRLRFLLDGIEQGWSPQCDNYPAGPEEWGVLKTGCVNGDRFDETENKRLPDDLHPRVAYEIHPGDFLMSRANTTALVGSAALVREVRPRLLLCDKLYRLRVDHRRLDPAFLEMFLNTPVGRYEFERDATGASGSMQNISQDAVRNLWIALPKLGIQRAIVDYLDAETARIDALIAAKENLLAILAEKRRAVITQAVTRGLDPSVPMRDSRVPWLGEIPGHWEVERSKWLFRERDVRSTTGEEELLTVSHLTGVTPRSEKNVTMFEAKSTVGYKTCVTGDLVINTMWAWMGAMGVAPCTGIVSPAYNVYEVGPRFLPAYIDALVRIGIFAEEVTRYSKGVWSSRLRLYPEGFFEVVFPVPPLHEQARIVEVIAHEVDHVDALSTAIRRSLTLARERREAVIAAAVTGQLDVET